MDIGIQVVDAGCLLQILGNKSGLIFSIQISDDLRHFLKEVVGLQIQFENGATFGPFQSFL